MEFGFTLKPEHSIERTIALTRQAEAAGFSYGWLFDAHVPFREVYPLLTLMAINTTHMRLGTCVTNPATREPSVTASALATLNEISGGRMDLGIGRGDSAVRVLGKPPTTMKTLEQAVTVIRDLVEGRTTGYEGADLELSWTGEWKLPVWIAGYGPMALAMTGRIADGLILQLADPDLIRWMVGLMHESAAKAGRDPAAIKVQAAAPAHVGLIEECREQVRWFPALVSSHVVDLVNKYPSDQLPESLTGYMRDREGDDYRRHAEVGSSRAAFVRDDVVDRFAVIGPPEEHVRRLKELSEAGVDQFNLYLMSGDEETQLEAYGSTIIPALRPHSTTPDPTITSVVGQARAHAASGAERPLGAIEAERDRALARYRRDRDTAVLEPTMDELDKRAARVAEREDGTGSEVPADVAVRYLRDLPETWRKAVGGRGRQLLADALVDGIEVL